LSLRLPNSDPASLFAILLNRVWSRTQQGSVSEVTGVNKKTATLSGPPFDHLSVDFFEFFPIEYLLDRPKGSH
jgi:hypothetical protein